MRILILLLCLLVHSVFAQETQQIRGTVSDRSSLQPIASVNVQLFQDGEATNMGGVTDTEGFFTIENVPLGRYSLVVTHVNYYPWHYDEILIKASKEQVFDIYMIEASTLLDEVTVSSEKAVNDLTSIGKQGITMEQTLRYAGNFFDPARLSTSFSNVSAANDQANNLVIRGNSPNNMIWMLEGVNIVNPNHTSNAGTISDRPTQNGGGVNILSSQVLGDVNFIKGGYDATYGNSLSGILDMSFREGNEKQSAFVAQASLLGLEFAGEGPMGSSGASFLFNYRYSTVGLLGLMGVDFGGEAIKFQDLAFKFSIPAGKGKISLFGVGGNSSNVFTAERDSSMWEYEKDGKDIDYSGMMGALGGSYKRPIGNRSSVELTTIYSAREDDRISEVLGTNYQPSPESYDILSKSLWSTKLAFTTGLGGGRSIDYGVYADAQSDSTSSYVYEQGSQEYINSGSLDGWLLQPFVSFSDQLPGGFSYQVGVRYNYFTWNDEGALEPRALLAYNFNASSGIYARYGRHTIRQLPSVYFATIPVAGVLFTPNVDLSYTSSQNFALGYNGTFSKIHFNTEVFYQSISQAPVEIFSSSYSVLNILEQQSRRALENEGTGTNYGLDVEARRNFSRDYYYLLAASFFNSSYTGSDGIERDARYNGNYTFQMTGGREFRKEKNGFAKTFEVNLKLLYLGGFNDTPINELASAAAGRTVYYEDQAFTNPLSDYVRLDARIAWTKNKPNYTRTISIDIQNLLNIQNDAYYYFDTYQQKTVLQTQLGIIPVIAYRVEF